MAATTEHDDDETRTPPESPSGIALRFYTRMGVDIDVAHLDALADDITRFGDTRAAAARDATKARMVKSQELYHALAEIKTDDFMPAPLAWVETSLVPDLRARPRWLPNAIALAIGLLAGQLLAHLVRL